MAHLDTASIAEILVRLVGAEEQTGMYLPPTQVRVCRLSPSYSYQLTLVSMNIGATLSSGQENIDKHVPGPAAGPPWHRAG